MLNLLAAGTMALSMLGGPIIIPTDPVPPQRIEIDVITVNGSGCPAGTAAVAVAPDNTAFTVTYSEYLAQVGVGAKPTDARKNCQLALQVQVPSGFTYAILQADYRGYAFLASGATATQRANYYFQGNSPTVYKSHPFSGPLDDNWQTTDTSEVASLVYAPCGELRYLNINTELRVAAGTSDITKTTSFVSMDSTDGSINTTYHFAWKRCNA
ncbi:protein of unknown function [Micromonospora pattaloongensis]|uniref:DUF4360 domain-containing protein n=1 Tax=Micromonospora pattaloongensis TaxID=405436 RepID=A0A1H3QS12_9ACTN|nr:DUF4360 domain-containing protein [Micromonospora pattaloongensis]SDZ15788.1 protein of unknown function [Micromonospora pattaloongensis]